MGTFRFPLEEGQALAFARAVDAGSEPDVDAIPLTFPVASAHFDPDYPLRPPVGEAWSPPTGGLHAEQHFDYHQPLVVGDELLVTEKAGRSWEKTSRSGAVLRFDERIAEYRSATTGDLVVTSRSVWLRG